MNQDPDCKERPRGYFVCLAMTLFPIIAILMIPVATLGLDQLPYALVMSVFLLFPILSCGTSLRGRPLFQGTYHGTPFNEEVMDISEDERIN